MQRDFLRFGLAISWGFGNRVSDPCERSHACCFVARDLITDLVDEEWEDDETLDCSSELAGVGGVVIIGVSSMSQNRVSLATRDEANGNLSFKKGRSG